jgi:hypothetical protein
VVVLSVEVNSGDMVYVIDDVSSGEDVSKEEEGLSEKVIIEVSSAIFNVVTESVVCIVLIYDDQVVGGVDAVVNCSEKYFDDSN